MTTHGSFCPYAHLEVKDGHWKDCRCANKVPNGPLDYEQARQEKGITDKLSGFHYLNQPLIVLQSHPDFSQEAFEIIAAISTMSTQEIERVIIFKGE